MAEAALRTLIVDDEPLAVERLQILAAGLPEIQLVGAANDAAAALRLIEALAPDLLLLDIAMPGMSGMELALALAPGAVSRALEVCGVRDLFEIRTA